VDPLLTIGKMVDVPIPYSLYE